MINVIAFLFFGAALYVGADIYIAIDKKDVRSLKTKIQMWEWWVGMGIYMVFWPLILGQCILKSNSDR